MPEEFVPTADHSAPPQEQAGQPSPGTPEAAMQSLEADPNHQLSMLIARRRTKKPDEASADKKPAAEEAEKPTEGKPRLNDLIASTLKFSAKKPEKPAEEKKEPEVAAKDDKAPEKEPEAKPAETKTIVSKKKSAPAPIDQAKVTADAATAAATAVVAAMRSDKKADEPAPVSVEDSMNEVDRREYTVAKFLGENNPKYKGAEKVILEHIKKTEEYATRWENANPGKIFDANHEDHNDFYEALKKPWSDEEFRDAEIDYKVEKRLGAREKQSSDEQRTELTRLTEDTTRIELNPTIDRTFADAAGELSKAMGDEVHNLIMKEGFEKLQESDPVTASVLTNVLGPLRPVIETIIQLDDPRQRIKFDASNPEHMRWRDIVLKGEKLCAGREDENGRMFATRAAYEKMRPADRQNHWYLTKEHIIAGVVDFATKTAAETVKIQKAEIAKAAEAMGYVKKDAAQSKTQVSKAKDQEKQTESAPASTKPQSPSVGSGAKIDETGIQHKTRKGETINFFAKELFRRA